ncbi:protein-L-isoaspartate O-methyltransferase [Bacteroidia bacterium]|nr:protein-L-isoaspartate O-methyltransferase [Bacteroidia bacterium]
MVKGDNFRAKGLRQRLIDSLRTKGITSEKVLLAMNNVPRHIFINSSFFEYAYLDKPFNIGNSQTISHPSTVAFQTQILEIKPKEKVLEIGTGCGYQTAVLIEMGAKVYSIERILDLHNKAKKTLEDHHYFASLLHYGDGYKGLPLYAPFDKILVTCGAPDIPEKLLKQLKIGGVIVIPIGEREQKMLRITKMSETEFEQEEFGDFKFVPMLGEKEFGK